MQAITKIEQTVLQRARGTIDLVMTDGKLERFYQSGSAKVFMPKTYAKTIEVVLTNTAGGLTGGDEFEVRVGAAGGMHLTISRKPPNEFIAHWARKVQKFASI